MFIKDDIQLKDFQFWGGSKAYLFTYEELETIENNLIDLYPDGMTNVAVNDLFWFEPETLCEWCGITEDELFEREVKK